MPNHSPALTSLMPVLDAWKASPSSDFPNYASGTWGPDAAHAVENAIALEAVAAMARDSLALAPDLEAAGDELRERHFRRKHGPAAYYGQEDGS